jgi:hypothetical protein
MKKLLLIILGVIIGLSFTAMNPQPISAGGVWTCYIPEKGEIISSEFSTGGGEKAFLLIEVDIRFKDGKVIKYLDNKVSASGFLGFGRFTIPDRIEFKRWDKDAISLES